VTELRRARLTVAYHGAGFHGFAANPGVRTVLGELAAAVATVVRQPVELTGAGRTDAGVHAWGQVVSGDLPESVDLGDLTRRVNKLCAPGIAVSAAEWAAPDFDARFSATWRQYRYHVWNDPSPNPLLAGTVWHVPKPLDVDAIALGAAALIGEHDFSSFCRRPSFAPDQPQPSMVRIVYELGCSRVDESSLRFEVRGSAFCHQQVRSMVGTLVDVGLGRIAAHRVIEILTARDRNAAGQVAPPEGLVLWAVGYDGTRWDSL
jgi:tRNA pseudouridine38-40 synthase